MKKLLYLCLLCSFALVAGCSDSDGDSSPAYSYNTPVDCNLMLFSTISLTDLSGPASVFEWDTQYFTFSNALTCALETKVTGHFVNVSGDTLPQFTVNGSTSPVINVAAGGGADISFSSAFTSPGKKEAEFHMTLSNAKGEYSTVIKISGTAESGELADLTINGSGSDYIDFGSGSGSLIKTLDIKKKNSADVIEIEKFGFIGGGVDGASCDIVVDGCIGELTEAGCIANVEMKSSSGASDCRGTISIRYKKDSSKKSSPVHMNGLVNQN